MRLGGEQGDELLKSPRRAKAVVFREALGWT